jgi:hypothetical protein
MRHPNAFQSQLATKNKSFLYYCDPEKSNKQWSGGIASHHVPPKKFGVQKSAGKVLASLDFWD